MTESSPLLTKKVSMPWEELEKLARGRTPARPVPVTETCPAPEAAPGDLSPAEHARLVSEITAQILPIVTERLHSELGTALDIAMRNAAQRLRGDLQRTIEANLRAAIAEAASRRLRRPQ